VGVCESGLAESEAEFVRWDDSLLVKGAVVDVKTFGEVVLWVWVEGDAWIQEGAVVGFLPRDGIRQVARRVDIAPQDVCDTVAGFLAREAGK
jgi:hypothetical protein